MFAEIADMAASESLQDRITGCVALEGDYSPEVWVSQNRWAVVAAPGWAEKWRYALDTGNPDPGADEAVVTDQDILAQVQSLRA